MGFGDNFRNKFRGNFNTRDLQGRAKRRAPGLVNIVAAVAYHFCLALGKFMIGAICGKYA